MSSTFVLQHKIVELLTNTFLKHRYGRQKPFHWTNINTQKHTHIHQTNVPSRSFSRNVPRVSKHKVSGKFPGGRCFRFFFDSQSKNYSSLSNFNHMKQKSITKQFHFPSTFDFQTKKNNTSFKMKSL